MEEQEIAAAIGWMMVASGDLAVMLSSVVPRHGYRATTAGPLLALLGPTDRGAHMGGRGRAYAYVGSLRLLSLFPEGRAPWRKRAQ
jgi:hypothetical protein